MDKQYNFNFDREPKTALAEIPRGVELGVFITAAGYETKGGKVEIIGETDGFGENKRFYATISPEGARQSRFSLPSYNSTNHSGEIEQNLEEIRTALNKNHNYSGLAIRIQDNKLILNDRR